MPVPGAFCMRTVEGHGNQETSSAVHARMNMYLIIEVFMSPVQTCFNPFLYSGKMLC